MRNTLLDLFNSRRADLKHDLDKTPSLDAATALLCGALDDLQRARLADLTAPQARRLAELLGVLRAAVGVLGAARRTTAWTPASLTAPASPRPTTNILKVRAFLFGPWPRALQMLICFGLFTVLYTMRHQLAGAWAALALVPTLIMLEYRWLLPSWQEHQGTNALRIDVQVDSDCVLDTVASALDVVDRAVGDAGHGDRLNTADCTTIGGFQTTTELLSVVQDLLGEMLQGDAERVLQRSRELPRALAQCGVQTRVFEAQDADASREDAPLDCFDLEPSLDATATDTIVLKPALLLDGKVLLRGRVVVPRDHAV
ncbi:MAG: hypothetical protein H6817_10960 [Phycisphaerales bacterium]|nr:hypothetical protein [Phycisphaerales bacterium]